MVDRGSTGAHASTDAEVIRAALKSNVLAYSGADGEVPEPSPRLVAALAALDALVAERNEACRNASLAAMWRARGEEYREQLNNVTTRLIAQRRELAHLNALQASASAVLAGAPGSAEGERP